MKISTVQRSVLVRARARECRTHKIESKIMRHKAETLIRVGKFATSSSLADVTVARIRWAEREALS